MITTSARTKLSLSPSPLPPAARDVVHACLTANCARPTPCSHKVAVSCCHSSCTTWAQSCRAEG
ncbi:hypothetical protein HBH56_123320 [Parastagonospora nodorum]|uniref:Uncharacterized protein n=1 Tax=Phaeosphaeria nodorum (strain SN15 / ATCC MYA-4574 / FGSC 10173) TaxID=321614 RepID=A0A7U2HTE6_PHANO|nr:hypothetical protein HBH56_123320 [Parastagonospora nodorum]QRC91125.1 hypothetical protein JI435_401020 [Parastagonospora nodorum SN15]KAH3934737.1 hypothetical protein HBH54_048860 [Parastagonospora nodorum]KAH3950179.1 hypothetical protein HBH53_080440 [Parastagonospora nodorum]KAH3987445.1 hypothetical protein HBH52_039200 [Parastagonospora nodorum]